MFPLISVCYFALITSSFIISEQWSLMAAAMFVCGFFGYLVYDAIMATASELLQRQLVVSPLLLIFAVHWLSSGTQLSLPIPGPSPMPSTAPEGHHGV
ncbi:hypothetical protein Ddye_023197 [Dipteronia dyeriana]|uniref:Uncharacterized protein n=1 Tax=Dipteronia dyeriana TaxID=168575 RepID=A0AAD9TTF9_9ROSI|nr:hypothetical protein Ddye_023197 [Dipteronia dyeriana]